MSSRTFRKEDVALFVRSYIAVVFLSFVLVNLGCYVAIAAESIEFDDGCDAGDKKCEFWKCYETGKCSEKDASIFEQKPIQQVSESPKIKKNKKQIDSPETVSEKKHQLAKSLNVNGSENKKALGRFLSSNASGLRKVSEACQMRVEPKKNSETNGLRIRRGAKIWTDPSVSGWYKIYHRKGHAYVQRNCF